MLHFLYSLRRGYRKNRGTLNFSQLVRQSSVVMAINLLRARSQNQTFAFAPDLSDKARFTGILTVIFYPDGITVEAFK